MILVEFVFEYFKQKNSVFKDSGDIEYNTDFKSLSLV